MMRHPVPQREKRGAPVTLTHEAFLADIVENPADPAPRLVFADWLDQNREPGRAGPIRLQCRLAPLPPGPELASLSRRESDLLMHHEADWRSDLPELEDVTWEHFSRG